MVENLEMLSVGLSNILTPYNLSMCIIGSMIGMILGALPGLGAMTGMALLMPMTFSMSPVAGVTMLGSIYYANMFGGAFSSILLNIPGDAPAIMTALDGYPMAKKGRPAQALFAANAASFIGGSIGLVILVAIGPLLAEAGLHFGPTEMCALMLLALTSIGWLTGESPTKGIVTAMLGVLLASVGMDTLTGHPRYDFGSLHLLGGIPFPAFAIGLFGFSQVLRMVEDRNKVLRTEIGGAYKDIVQPIRRIVVAPAAMEDRAAAFWAEALKKVSESPRWANEYVERTKTTTVYLGPRETKAYLDDLFGQFKK